MLSLLVLILIIFFVLRVYHFDKAKHKTVYFIHFSRRIFSFQYLIPFQIKGLDENVTMKKKANFFLYGFYVVFLIIVLYGIFKYGIR